MNWDIYKENFIHEAKKHHKNENYINKWLEYAYNLNSKKLPIIYDQNHMCELIGFDKNYVYAISNGGKHFYRTFEIKKKNGGTRIIHEPLPNLKDIQRWILKNILDYVEVSPYAKAYRKGYSVKDNVKFHRRQKKVLCLDIHSFYDSLKSDLVLDVFIKLGYNNDVAIMLTNLCCLNYKLPQGAPTSSSLSNIIMKKFDYSVSDFCKNNAIRYTRYADDMTFSGDFDEINVIRFVRNELKKINLRLNNQKTRVRIQGQQQLITGIVVNEKTQLPKKKRKEIRQTMYYIKKYGINEHMNFKNIDKSYYLEHIMGIVNYGLFLNPKDSELIAYRNILQVLKKSQD